jgi:signal transduction histidine kinase
MLEVSVTDNGPGIPDAMKPTLFDRFMENSSTRSSFGLGLHITKMLFEAYGGKIWADNRVEGHPELGAAIRFTLKRGGEGNDACCSGMVLTISGNSGPSFSSRSSDSIRYDHDP